MGKFEITKRSNGEHQFNLKASNGQVILSSEGYTSKAGCLNGVESVKKHAVKAQFEQKKSANGKFYFNLKATNGQIIGKSEMYESEKSCEAGIASVIKNASDAGIEDNS